MMRRIFFFIVLALGVASATAEEPLPTVLRPEESFAKGIELFRTGNLEESAKLFKGIVDAEPRNTQALLNWGLAEFQLGRRGLALGTWRRALAIDPDFSAAHSAVEFAMRQLNLREGRSSVWERFRGKVLNLLSLNSLLAANVLLMVLGGWLVIRYVGRRRRSLETESPLPPWPTVGLVFSACFILTAVLALLKGVDLLVPRATVIVHNAPVYSAPTETSSTLFEIAEGSDVILRQTKKGWTQIRSPGGMSGWIVESSLFPTSGRLLW